MRLWIFTFCLLLPVVSLADSDSWDDIRREQFNARLREQQRFDEIKAQQEKFHEEELDIQRQQAWEMRRHNKRMEQLYAEPLEIDEETLKKPLSQFGK